MTRGFTLLEVAVAIAVLALAGIAAERLVVRSIVTVDHDARRARTLLAARDVVAETALAPPPPGRESTTRSDGLRVVREVMPTGHPALAEVHVRVTWADGGDASDLVELVYAPVR